MIEQIKLDFNQDLPRIIEATLAHKLQAQQPNPKMSPCLYAGPCAIGVLIPRRDALRLDQEANSSILNLLNADLISVPFEQEGDWMQLQDRHDSFMGSTTHDAELQFLRTLRDICQKYYPEGVTQLAAYSFVYEKSNTENPHA